MRDLPAGQFQVINADPPWAFSTRTHRGQGRGASQHYPVLTTAEICALPVERLAAPKCTLFLWTTWPHLPDALEVVKAWGFTYKTVAFVWFKLRKNAPPRFWLDPQDFHMGLGYGTRSNTEVAIRASRGNVGVAKNRGVRQQIIAPIREHSRKPDAQYERIEAMYDGPYLELFARQERPGWTAFGNQTGRFASLPLTEGARVIHDRNMQQVRT